MTHSDAEFRSHRISPWSLVVRGAVTRIVLSVLVPVAWISLTLIYVAFYAPTWTVFQDFVVAVVSLLALIGVITAMWVAFGLRVYHDWVDE